MSGALWRLMGVGSLAGGLMAVALLPWPGQAHPALPALLGVLAWWLVSCHLDAISRSGESLKGLRRGWRPAFVLGWVFGSVWLLGATGWLYVSLHRYGGLPSWMAATAVGALCTALSLYMAAAFALWARWRQERVLIDALLWGCLITLAETARALVFTGFPWGALGYLHVDSPLARLAPWVGVYGLSWVHAGVVMAWALAWRRRAWTASVTTGVIVLGGVGALTVWAGPAHFVQPHGRPLSVSLLQGNVPQDEKFAQGRQLRMLVWHAQQLLASTDDLVLAPETAIPLLPSDLPEGFFDSLLQPFQTSSRAALFGMPLGSFDQGYSNSVVGVSAATVGLPNGFYRYNKHHLVPFGEVIPWGFHWFVRLMNMPLGDFTRGQRQAPSFRVADQWVAPNICYEDLFGEELAARFVQPGHDAPTVLANVSNLAWFGDTVAVSQHLQIARMRSLEFQRPTLRATNTGATVVIDHRGEVTHRLPFNTQGVLRATVQGTQGLTPYARWAGAWGLWPLVVACAMGVCGVVMLGRGRSGAGGASSAPSHR